MSKDKGYKCSLCPETLERAKKELNEHEETRLMEVNILRKRIKNVPGLTPRTDTIFLLSFLRGHRFDQEKTFKLIKQYYQIRVDKPEIFADLKPTRVRHAIETKGLQVLRHRDALGRRVIVFRTQLWDVDRCSFIDNMKHWAIVAQRFMEDEETTVNGIHFVYVMNHLTMKHITALGRSNSKLLITLAFYCFPLHIRQVDFVFENPLFGVFFALFTPLLDPEVMSRIRFNGKNIKVLQETIHPDHLPVDLGGNLEMFSNQGWCEEFLEWDKWYEETNKFGFCVHEIGERQKEEQERTCRNERAWGKL